MTERDRAEFRPLDTTTDVETPEHVRFSHRLAGPGLRAGAYLVDLLVRGAIVSLFVVLAVFGATGDADKIGEQLEKASMGIAAILIFGVEWGYYVLFETLWSGRTIGRRVFRLRVMNEGGFPVTFNDSALRNLLRAADFLPIGYAVGLVVMIADRRFRRLGDLVAGTMVVVEQSAHLSAPLQIRPAPTAHELEELPQRLPLGARDIEALDVFLRRVGTLPEALEAELAEIVAPVYARRIGVRYRDPVRFLGLLYHVASGAGRHRSGRPF